MLKKMIAAMGVVMISMTLSGCALFADGPEDAYGTGQHDGRPGDGRDRR